MKDRLKNNLKYQLFKLGGYVPNICIIRVPDEDSKTKQKMYLKLYIF